MTRDDALALDRADPLAHARARFVLPQGVNYLDGNSLGSLPRGLAERVAQTVTHEWGEGLIRSWNAAGWYEAPGRIGAKLAPLLGAAPHQVTVTDTISVNLFKLLVAAARMRTERKVILAERGNFPSDNHIVESVARMMGLTARFVPAGEIATAIDADTAVVELSHVNYRTAEIQDMAAITRAAHEKGALIVWDLAHSSGAVELHLDRDQADFAVGCGYKFLNGGPGAPAHVYVAERHLPALDQPLTGWFAHAAPFAFADDFAPAGGIRAMLCSTPQMLSMVAFEAALTAFDGIAMRDVQAKGRALGDLMIALADERLVPHGVGIASTRDGAPRGNHVSLTHPEGHRIMQALIARGIIGDFRAPDVMRFGFGALYVRYVDVFDAVTALEEILRFGAWREVPLPKPGAVT
ncbi:MAG: kynureninase [Alphaproteobacteria bacterium]